MHSEQDKLDQAIARLKANLAMWRRTRESLGRHGEPSGAAPPCASGQHRGHPQIRPLTWAGAEQYHDEARKDLP